MMVPPVVPLVTARERGGGGGGGGGGGEGRERGRERGRGERERGGESTHIEPHKRCVE